MATRVKITVKAANALLAAVRWRKRNVEYRVMIRHESVDSNGRKVVQYRYAYSVQRWSYDTPHLLVSQETYRDALLDLDRLTPENRANAVIVRITTEVPR